NDHAMALLSSTPAETREIAEKIMAQIDREMDRLASLIDSFLEMSTSVERDRRIELAREVFEVRDMVEESVQLAQAAAGRCVFTTQIGEEVGKIHADRQKIARVLVNILA